jgi:hypothetical protein
MPRRRRLSWFERFTCPNCTALYHVVKVEAGAKTTDRDIACRCCGALFACREGQFSRQVLQQLWQLGNIERDAVAEALTEPWITVGPAAR